MTIPFVPAHLRFAHLLQTRIASLLSARRLEELQRSGGTLTQTNSIAVPKSLYVDVFVCARQSGKDGVEERSDERAPTMKLECEKKPTDRR